MVTKEQLKELRILVDEAAKLADKIGQCRMVIKDSADVGEDVTAEGVRVYWKAGGKKTKHEDAVKAHRIELINERLEILLRGEGSDIDLTQIESDIDNKMKPVIDKHTKPGKPSYSWAKITKELMVNIKPFTAQADPTLTIEVQ